MLLTREKHTVLLHDQLCDLGLATQYPQSKSEMTATSVSKELKLGKYAFHVPVVKSQMCWAAR